VSKRLRMAGILVAGMLTALALVACGGDSSADGLSGSIEVDGSSTVFPITEAVAEEFRRDEPNVQVNVGVSGTGGGFKRFVAGETDISDASRPIKASEAEAAAANGIEFIEMRVGTDGLSVVVNPDNDFASCLTVAELAAIWEPGSTIENWSQVRAGFPDQRLRLYGPGTDSGTFDYFTEEIVGEVQSSRADYTASEDDNVLVQGVGGDRGALGYFGFAYYIENASRVNAVSIDNGNGCVEPSVENIEAGDYTPLSRPLFIYVNKASLDKPEVAAFVKFYMEHGAELTAAVGYVASDASVYAANLAEAGL
jgi:phosphate transport system substrate-binding protein